MKSVETLEKELKQSILDSIYLLYGEETFLLETCLKKIKTNFGKLQDGINYIKLEEKNILDLIPNIETPAFGFEKKLIIIRDSGLFKKIEKKKTSSVNMDQVSVIANYFKENINMIKKSLVIVFVEEEAVNNDLYKVIDEFRSSYKF